MIWIALLLIVGILLSALFSGSETGFYRVSRVRLVLDGLAGDGTARRLLWLTNNPSLFVATTLVGNNVANYLTSLAIVLASQRMFGSNIIVEFLGPILLAPILFVYGESLPKSFFLRAPNFLLHATHPLFLFFGVLFSPIAAMLWLFGRALRKVLGKSPEIIRLSLARKELAQVLREGHEAGILKPIQHELAQSLFAISSQPIGKFAIPRSKLRYLRTTDDREKGLKLARKLKSSRLPVAGEDGAFAGYVTAIDLNLGDADHIGPIRKMLNVGADDNLCSVIVKMQTERIEMAQVLGKDGKSLGVVSESDLADLLEVNFGSTR